MKETTSLKKFEWSRMDLQSRLLLVFTLLFGFSVIMLSLIMYNNVRLVALDNRARVVFEQNRKIYQLYSMTQQYEVAMNNYELNASELARIDLKILDIEIGETASALRPSFGVEDQDSLDKFTVYMGQLSEVVSRLAERVDEEAWSEVLELDNTAYEILEPLFAQLDSIGERGLEQLFQVWRDVENFGRLITVSTALAVPLFLLLAGITALVVYNQINQPMEQLARAAKGVTRGDFDAAELQKLAARSDEVGVIAADFLAMSEAVRRRSEQLRQEADEIRARIR
jgi:methyl-accepting chemotaxis protein